MYYFLSKGKHFDTDRRTYDLVPFSHIYDLESISYLPLPIMIKQLF